MRVRKVGNAVLLEPIEKKFDAKTWLAKVQALGGPDFLPDGRPEQPPMPDDDETSFD